MDNYYLTRETRIYNGMKTVSSINSDEKIGQIHAYTRINSKWTKDKYKSKNHKNIGKRRKGNVETLLWAWTHGAVYSDILLI